LPYRYQLRQVPLPGTKETLVGTAFAPNGAHIDVAISICDGKCPVPAVPPIPHAAALGASGGTGWVYLGNGEANLPGQTHAQAETRKNMDARIFDSLCRAAHEPTCV
jgi:hypothetical protein